MSGWIQAGIWLVIGAISLVYFHSMGVNIAPAVTHGIAMGVLAGLVWLVVYFFQNIGGWFKKLVEPARGYNVEAPPIPQTRTQPHLEPPPIPKPSDSLKRPKVSLTCLDGDLINGELVEEKDNWVVVAVNAHRTIRIASSQIKVMDVVVPPPPIKGQRSLPTVNAGLRGLGEKRYRELIDLAAKENQTPLPHPSRPNHLSRSLGAECPTFTPETKVLAAALQLVSCIAHKTANSNFSDNRVAPLLKQYANGWIDELPDEDQAERIKAFQLAFDNIERVLSDGTDARRELLIHSARTIKTDINAKSEALIEKCLRALIDLAAEENEHIFALVETQVSLNRQKWGLPATAAKVSDHISPKANKELRVHLADKIKIEEKGFFYAAIFICVMFIVLLYGCLHTQKPDLVKEQSDLQQGRAETLSLIDSLLENQSSESQENMQQEVERFLNLIIPKLYGSLNGNAPGLEEVKGLVNQTIISQQKNDLSQHQNYLEREGISQFALVTGINPETLVIDRKKNFVYVEALGTIVLAKENRSQKTDVQWRCLIYIVEPTDSLTSSSPAGKLAGNRMGLYLQQIGEQPPGTINNDSPKPTAADLEENMQQKVEEWKNQRSETMTVKTAEDIQKVVKHISDEINTLLPMRVDSETMLLKTSPNTDNSLLYRYKLPNTTADQIEYGRITKNAKPKAVATYKTSMPTLKTLGVTLVYEYIDKNGNLIERFTVGPKDL